MPQPSNDTAVHFTLQAIHTALESDIPVEAGLNVYGRCTKADLAE
jgi:hypothetical protein